jgi:hypothetical protein
VGVLEVGPVNMQKHLHFIVEVHLRLPDKTTMEKLSTLIRTFLGIDNRVAAAPGSIVGKVQVKEGKKSRNMKYVSKDSDRSFFKW